MLHGQGELVAVASEIQIGVAQPCNSLTRARPGWTEGGAILFGVMNQEDGQVELALELTQKAEQGAICERRSRRAGATDQGIQNEQEGLRTRRVCSGADDRPASPSAREGVMTCKGRSANPTAAAAAKPSSR